MNEIVNNSANAMNKKKTFKSKMLPHASRVFLFLYLIFYAEGHKNHSISKRYVLFPEYTVLQFTYGLSVPAILPSRSINLSLCLQVNYVLPFNVTNFLPNIIMARDTNKYFDFTREAVYKYVIRALESFGLDGEDCLLRLICDASSTPFHIGGKNGLLEDIAHFVLTPSYDLDIGANFTIPYDDALTFPEKTMAAEFVGKSGRNCRKTFDKCRLSLIDLFTQKFLTF